MKKLVLTLAAIAFFTLAAYAQTVQDSAIYDAMGAIFAYFNGTGLFEKMGYAVAFIAIILNILPTKAKMLVSQAIDFLKAYDNYIANILRKALELFNTIVADKKSGGGTHAS